MIDECLTHNTQRPRDGDWPRRVELTDVFAGIRLLHALDIEEPGISAMMRHSKCVKTRPESCARLVFQGFNILNVFKGEYLDILTHLN